MRSGGRTLRFVYRTSPEPLVPQNFFHYVTQSDPPMDVAGMSTVILDLSGRLVTLTRLVSADDRPADRVSWADLFADAGIPINDYEQAAVGRRPLVPHDSVLTWVRRRPTDLPASISAATFGGTPVYFETVGPGFVEGSKRGVLSTQRSAGAEAILWVFIVIIFTATIVMVRRNLRAGEGDLQGARRLATFVAGAGLLSTMLNAHHVPSPTPELLLTLSVCGWVLVWGGFSWLSYVAFEPHVRRLWPRSIISWTRVLAGRVPDPLVGRDVLLGMLAGVLIVGTSLLLIRFGGHRPSGALGVALDSLRSPRHLLSRVIFAAVDGIQYALGGFFMLLFLRLVLRRTWLAVIAFVAMCVPISGNSPTVAGVVHAAGGAALAAVVFLQVGLLAGVSMLMTDRLLTYMPLTLDFSIWYAGSSIVIMLFVVALAIWACTMTIRPAATRIRSR